VVFLNNPEAELTSFAFDVNTGYFDESKAFVSEGIAHLLMDSILDGNKEDKIGQKFIEKRGKYRALSTSYYMVGDEKDLKDGVKFLWESIANFGRKGKAKLDLRHIDFK
jgi:predicted Zn-dependent peptidase